MPRALGRTHPKHKTPHIAIFTVGALNVALIVAFWGLNRVPLDMYGWMAVQGVIWIVLVQALTALSTFVFFKREYPAELHWWKTIAAPWIGFIMQVYVLILLYSNLYFLAAGAWYVNPVFEIPWVDVAVDGQRAAVLVDRHHRRARPGRRAALRVLPAERQPGQVRGAGPLRQRGRGVILPA